MPSHYARKNTSKEFLESELTMKKMYDLYVQSCEEKGEEPCKLHLYRMIFNYDFNIDFYKPKKDLCDTCQEYEAQSKANSLDETLRSKYEKHLSDKEEAKAEREKDRKDKTKAVICFDLQNVLSCPRANVSNFFYKRKLSVFNLTAHLSLTKTAYNALWCEGTAGRGGNEIASALMAILHRISTEHSGVHEFTLWSDSCVAQNRNSLMTLAIKRFMIDHPNITKITQKYCTPGHSSIQEVDNIHSHLEKGLKLSEVYSPVSFLRVYKRIRPDKSVVIQLQESNLSDYKKALVSLKCSSIPYSKVKCLHYDAKKPFHLDYKTSFADEFKEESIHSKSTRSGYREVFPSVYRISKRPTIPTEKKNDIRSMMKFMSEVDRQYYDVLFKQKKRTVSKDPKK